MQRIAGGVGPCVPWFPESLYQMAPAHCPALGTHGVVNYWTASSHYSAVVGSVSPEISIPGSGLASNTWKQGNIGHVTKVLCAYPLALL